MRSRTLEKEKTGKCIFSLDGMYTLTARFGTGSNVEEVPPEVKRLAFDVYIELCTRLDHLRRYVEVVKVKAAQEKGPIKLHFSVVLVIPGWEQKLEVAYESTTTRIVSGEDEGPSLSVIIATRLYILVQTQLDLQVMAMKNMAQEIKATVDNCLVH